MTNDFPDRKGTVVPKSVLMSISMVLNVFFCSGTHTSGLKTRCMFVVGVDYAKKWCFRVSHRDMFQNVTIDVNRMNTSSQIWNQFRNSRMAIRITKLGAVTRQMSQVLTELDLYATRCTSEIRHLDLSADRIVRKFQEKRVLSQYWNLFFLCTMQFNNQLAYSSVLPRCGIYSACKHIR